MPPEESSNEPSSAERIPVRRPSLEGTADGGSLQRRDFTRPVVSRRPVAAGSVPSASVTPPVSAEPVNIQPPRITEAPSPPLPPAAASAQPQPPLDFKPPSKRLSRRRRFMRTAGLVLTGIVLLAGVAWLVHWQTSRNNPDTVFRQALQNSLSTRQLTTLQTGATPLVTQEINHDFTNMKNPTVDGQATVQLSGTDFDINTYGTLKNTYLSYQQLPGAIPSSFKAVVPGSWIRLKADGTLPPGISTALAQAADPVYQNFGPVVFGDFSAATQRQLLDYAAKNRVYPYQTASVERRTLGDKPVFVYSMKLNVGYLKLLNQSAAGNQGIAPDALRAAASSLDAYKDATVKMYVARDSQRFIRAEVTKNGRTLTVVYRNYNQAQLANEPQTKLEWATFAPFQYQMETLAAARQSPAARDAERKQVLASLHDALAVYFAQNESYPMLAEMNDQKWVAANLTGADPAWFRDPQGVNLQLTALPKAGNYSYQALSADGKTLCDGSAANPCSHYRLTAVFSNNQPYVVQDP